ncbi:MAG: HpcH/HpaI aldolase/citrate lyase family protein [Pseudomonadota bacterium]
MKAALAAGERQMGLWIAMAHATSAEIAGKAGFDFCLIDGEHSPNDIPLILDQVRAISMGSAQPAVRIPVFDPTLVKQVLDIGVQTILVPMIDTAEEAARVVASTRYAPAGFRGVGAAQARASNFGEITDMLTSANDQICVLVQCESVTSVKNIDAIAAVEGVDAVFIGPADLSADMGLPGQITHPDVEAQIRQAMDRINAAGKAVGIISFDPAKLQDYIGWGARFVAVGGDVSILARGIRQAAALAGDLKGN